MTDNMIVKPANPISRRRFFMFLGAAAASPIIHSIVPKKLIFDMSRPVRMATLDELNRITMRYIIPALTDAVFSTSPTFNVLILRRITPGLGADFDIPPGAIITGIEWSRADWKVAIR